MIAAEIQQRDEALTAAGHDPECAAFDDRECSCQVGTSAVVQYVKAAKAKSKGGPYVTPLTEQIILEGDHARAYRRWANAMAALRTAKEVFAAAGQEAQAAHEALAMLSVGAP